MIRKIAKITAVVAASIAALAVVIAMLLVGGVYLVFGPSGDEVACVASPDRRFVATVIEVNGGATTAFAYEVHVERPGALFAKVQVASFYGAIRGASAAGVNLRWKSNAELVIEYLRARRAALEVPEWRSGGSDVKVSLLAGVEDASAPAGSMLDNRSP